MTKLKKAIIPIAGMGTRFLPLSKIIPKEFFPLVDKPVIQYIIEEAANSGIKEIVFVNSPGKKEVLDYFKENKKLEAFLKKRNKNHVLGEIKKLEELAVKISFSQVIQKEQMGDGHAILQAEKSINKEPAAVLFGDDVIYSRVPCLEQMRKIFEKYNCPVVALYRLPKERLSFYGIVSVKHLAGRTYEIGKIVEKPKPEEAPSNLAIVGKYIITPEVIDYLKNWPCEMAGEIKLVGALEKMIEDGKMVLGCEVEGQWLECGNKQGWLESNIYLSLKHPEFGEAIKKFIKEIK